MGSFPMGASTASGTRESQSRNDTFCKDFPPSRSAELLERALGWKEAALREFRIEESSLRERFPRLAHVQLLE